LKILDSLSQTDSRRRIVMNLKKKEYFFFFEIVINEFANKIETLLLTKNVQFISKFYHYMNELLMIRRLIASIFKFNDKDFISRKSMIFHHKIRIVELF
jgi:hypothetical protein